MYFLIALKETLCNAPTWSTNIYRDRSSQLGLSARWRCWLTIAGFGLRFLQPVLHNQVDFSKVLLLSNVMIISNICIEQLSINWIFVQFIYSQIATEMFFSDTWFSQPVNVSMLATRICIVDPHYLVPPLVTVCDQYLKLWIKVWLTDRVINIKHDSAVDIWNTIHGS